MMSRLHEARTGRWSVAVGIVVGGLLTLGGPFCEAGFYVNSRGTMIWHAPDSSWCVAGFGHPEPGAFRKVLDSRPPGLEVLKMWETEEDEGGLWLGFSVIPVKVERVVFTKRTRIVLMDKAGKRIESEASRMSSAISFGVFCRRAPSTSAIIRSRND